MEIFGMALELLPPPLRQAARTLEEPARRDCEELRLRLGRPLSAGIGGREYGLASPPVTAEDILHVLEKASRASLHSVEQQLCRGFVTAPGGLRLGLCGQGVTEGESLRGLRDFSSLCLRLPRQHRGCADGIYPALTAGGFRSALILSPPGGGKTTLLRELVRRLSEQGSAVALADERGEVAGQSGERFGFDPGPRTDVMTGVPKARAAMMLLRSMNPRILAMDEISEPEDARALRAALGCGVTLLATAHGDGAEDLRRRPALAELMEQGAFERLVRIERRGRERRYEVKELCDGWERCF